MKLRVGFFFSYLEVGGAERLVQNLAPALALKGIDSYFLCLYTAGSIGTQLREAGFPVEVLGCRSRFDWRIARWLSEWLHANRIQILYTIDSPLPMAWAGLARRRGWVERYCIGYHSHVRIGRLWQRYLAERIALPVADRVIALSDSHRRALQARYHLPNSRLVVIPNGVDTHFLKPPDSPSACKQQLGFDPSTPLVSIVAQLRPEKNHRLFIEAARRVHPSDPQARFLIVGSGPLREELEAQVKKLQAEGYVHFLGLRQDLPLIWGASDIGVLCSSTEALPISLIEAGACGVPAVATRVGGIEEVIQHERTGLLVPPADPQALAAAILSLLADPVKRAELGERFLHTVRERFSMEHAIESYAALFHSLLTNG